MIGAYSIRIFSLVAAASLLIACSISSYPEQQATNNAIREITNAITPEIMASQTPSYLTEPIISLNLAMPEERVSIPTSLIWTGTNQMVVSDQEGVAFLNLPDAETVLPQADISPHMVAPSTNPLFLTGSSQGKVIAWVSDQTTIQIWDSLASSTPISLTTFDFAGYRACTSFKQRSNCHLHISGCGGHP